MKLFDSSFIDQLSGGLCGLATIGFLEQQWLPAVIASAVAIGFAMLAGRMRNSELGKHRPGTIIGWQMHAGLRVFNCKPHTEGVPLQHFVRLDDHLAASATGSMTVDEAMVETVGAALYIYWDDVNQQAKDAYRKKVRDALTFAISRNRPGQ
jgi:hypothetical protein